MRLFVALEVPGDVRGRVDAAVAPVRDRFPGLRWTRPEAWHLTLAFLGEVGPAVAERLPDALAPGAALAPPALSLSLAGPGAFGTRVLWLGVADEPAGAVAALGARLQDAAAGEGIEVDRKPVRPHLTLARARGRDAVSPMVVDACPHVEARWSADRAVLYRSELGGGPARHEPLATLVLGTGSGG